MMQSKGLESNELKLNSLLFCNKDIGFIVGNSDKIVHNSNAKSDTFAFVSSAAYIYQTTDGGNTWVGKEFGEGRFIKILKSNNTLFAFKISEKNFHTDIYSSEDLGKSWSLLIV